MLREEKDKHCVVSLLCGIFFKKPVSLKQKGMAFPRAGAGQKYRLSVVRRVKF